MNTDCVRQASLASAWMLETTGAVRIEAWAAIDNEPCQRVLAAAGFMRQGVLRSFLGDEAADARRPLLCPAAGS